MKNLERTARIARHEKTHNFTQKNEKSEDFGVKI